MYNNTETYDFLKSIFGASPFGIVIIDMNGEISLINEQAVVLLAIDKPLNKVIDTRIIDYLEGLEKVKVPINECIENGRKEIHIPELAFGEKHLSIRIHPVLWGQSIAIEDISDRVLARQQEFKAILTGQENERQRLASEIHDGLGPMLSTIKIKAESLMDLINEETALRNKILDISNLIDSVSDDTRSISHALSPSSLRKLGLISSLSDLCEKANKDHDANIVFTQNGRIPDGSFREQIKLNIYRIAQELLNNSLKYSLAKNINLQLTYFKNEFLLSLEDDGIGFDKESVLKKRGIGLTNIESRAKLLGGNFDIDSRPGHGVTASIHIPLDALNKSHD